MSKILLNKKDLLKNLKKNNKFLYIYYYVKTNNNCQFYIFIAIFIIYILIRIFMKKRDEKIDPYENIDDNIDEITFTKKKNKSYSLPSDVNLNESDYIINYMNSSNNGNGVIPPGL